MTLQLEIVLSKSHIDSLRNHAMGNLPNESCAILFGKSENEHFLTKEIFLTKNVEKSPVSFTISNDELISAYGQAEKKNLEIIGIFHSHPDSVAYPSTTDQKYMKVNPIPWIIFSNITNEFRVYILESTVVPIVMTVL
ncbi:Desampylase [uncultured archaeon]|nr:Desampylase [uncultured archaeon]